MKVLKIDLDIPFWCSFGQYGTMNIQQTYPFPPPPTIFGMILNAMGKLALHTLNEENAKKKLSDEYLDAYSKLKFAIVIRNDGEKIDDFLNILKVNRERGTSRSGLNDLLSKEIKELRQNIKEIKKTSQDDKEKSEEEMIEEYFSNFWKSKIEKYGRHRIDKIWMRTQIHKQRLIQPKYTVYIHSSVDSGEYSLEHISSSLRKPKRPLYLGDSDSIVDIRIEGSGIVEADENYKSSCISSILPGIHQNSRIVMVPINLRNDLSEKNKLICSIPYSDISKEISCLDVGGESIVFLQYSSKK